MIGYLECSTGVSGDKFLGALIDAGFDLNALRDALSSAGLTDVVVDAGRAPSGGISATGITVAESAPPHRSWRGIRALLEDAPLPGPAREGALAALDRLARAEASVHGVALEDVHFHEIGGADTIVDILGVALALHYFDIDQLVVSPIAVGSGTVETAHGTLPIPAPATAALLEHIVVTAGPVPGELTTPTGAALVAAFATSFGLMPPMTLRRVGCGRGSRDLGIPNICRFFLGEAAHIEPGYESVAVLETNLDHLTGEEIGLMADRMRGNDVLDVWLTPIYMKKGRPATLLSVLVVAAEAPRLAERIIAETGTLGVRIVPAERRTMLRDVTEIETTLGTARFKVAYLPDGTRTLRVESDEARRLSAVHGIPADMISRMLESEAFVITGIQPMRQRPSSQTTNPSD